MFEQQSIPFTKSIAMIFRFRLLSNEQEDFVCDIDCRSDEYFSVFHQTIREALGFELQEMASFFMCGAQWEKGQEIALLDVREEGSDVLLMEETRLNDLIEQKRQKLLYVFDFFNERVIFIELAEILHPVQAETYPRLVSLQGRPPEEVPGQDAGIDDDILDEFMDDDLFDESEGSDLYSDPYR